MIIATILIILLLTLGCDTFIYFNFLKNWPLILKIVWWVPTALLLLATYMLSKGHWGWPMTMLIIIIFCFALPKTLFSLVSLFGQLIGLLYYPIGGWFNIAGCAIAFVVSLCGIYSLTFGWKRITMNNVAIISPDLPSRFDGYKIALITDLHLGTFGEDTAYIDELVSKINGQNPDLIVFAGDLVNFTYHEAVPFRGALSRLRAKDGVVSVLGNHDYALYAPQRHAFHIDELVDSLCDLEREAGWRLLLDDNIPIRRDDDTLWVVGVQNIGRHFSANKGNLGRALSGIPEGSYKVLISHDPTHWEDEVEPKTDIQLTLSGHTHAMQFKIFGWSPSSLIFRYWGGHHQIGKQHLYVSTGAGGNLPFRFGAWPEVTLLTLRK